MELFCGRGCFRRCSSGHLVLGLLPLIPAHLTQQAFISVVKPGTPGGSDPPRTGRPPSELPAAYIMFVRHNSKTRPPSGPWVPVNPPHTLGGTGGALQHVQAGA